jgi:hypothetical protein
LIDVQFEAKHTSLKVLLEGKRNFSRFFALSKKRSCSKVLSLIKYRKILSVEVHIQLRKRCAHAIVLRETLEQRERIAEAPEHMNTKHLFLD